MSQPLRVAHVMGKMVGGGVESVVMNYYRHIDRSRVQFDFFVDEDSTDVPRREIEGLGGLVIAVPPYQQVTRHQNTLLKLFGTGKWKIVHSHVNTISVFPLRAAKAAGVPIRIAHNHATAGKGEYAKNTLKYALRPFANMYPTHRLACSNYAGRWLFGKRHFDVVNNAFDVASLKYSEQKRLDFRRRLHIGDHVFAFGHAGRFAPPKNQDYLIRLFASVLKHRSDAVLLLAGSGPDLPACRKLADELGISKCVFFLGQFCDMASFYSAIDAFLLPSTYEGLGLALVEAQASGLPCFASSAVTQEANPTGTVVFLDLKDKKLWFDAMADTERRVDRILGILEARALTRFDIGMAAPKLVDYYENAALLLSESYGEGV